MDEEIRRFIDESYEKAMKDTDLLTEDDLVRMLSLDPESEECAYLGSRAREIARVKVKNRAQVSTAFGIDYQPCAASCRYCSFGKEWHDRVCDKQSWNKQCKGAGCPYSPLRQA